MERGAYDREESGSAVRSKERSRLGKVGGLFGLEKSVVHEEQSPGPAGNAEWKEFRPGACGIRLGLRSIARETD